MIRKYNFHKGHSVEVIVHNGQAHLHCKDCGVFAQLESVSAEISPADAVVDYVKETAYKPTVLSKMSKGVTAI